MHATILIDPDALSTKDQKVLEITNIYQTELAQKMDLMYQAIHKGLIPSTNTPRSPYQDLTVEHLCDNYSFTRRYFGNYKALYILAIRVFSMRNPVTEISAYLNSRKESPSDSYLLNEHHDSFSSFESTLLRQKPFVSVIIPTLNRYVFLKNVLEDLELQTYTNFEVIICDQSDKINEFFYTNWNLNVKLIRQDSRALWLARNTCISSAAGNYIALTEDDVRLPKTWLEDHIKCIDYFNVNISCGIFFPEGKKPVKSQSYFQISTIFATGNTLIRKEVFSKTGLFDRQFEGQRMGDGEFGLRCLLNDEKMVLNPLAYCVDVKAPTGGLREMGSWDALRSNRIFAARPVPSVLYYIRKYFGNHNAVLYIIQNVPFSFIPYKLKRSKLAKVISLFLIPLFFPLIINATIKSWRSATQKLREGAIIALPSK